MDRRNYPSSVVPYPINKARSVERPVDSRSVSRDENDEWDARWLRPALSASPSPMPVVKTESAPVRQQVAEERTAWQPQVDKEAAPKEALYLRVLRWLFPDVNQRRAKRFPTPGLVAYYWTGGTAYSYQVGDISATGLFLLTKEKWAPGTLIQMTLQQREGPKASNSYLSVLSEVVRWGENGTGCNFVLADDTNVGNMGILPSDAVDRKSVERFLQHIGVPNRAG
jgi:hypothetical protein